MRILNPYIKEEEAKREKIDLRKLNIKMKQKRIMEDSIKVDMKLRDLKTYKKFVKYPEIKYP